MHVLIAYIGRRGWDLSYSIRLSYRKWNLGETQSGVPIVVVARTELDGALPALDSSSEPSKLTIKAFNEWDSALAGGVQWRSKLDQQKAAVLASELKNNGSKLAKWTLQVDNVYRVLPHSISRLFCLAQIISNLVMSVASILATLLNTRSSELNKYV